MPTTISLPLYCNELIGRDVEIQALLDAFDKVRAGQSQTVIISGEAGIGKSRLVSTFLEFALERAPTVGTFTGHCYVSLSSTYAPFEEALGEVLKRPSRGDGLDVATSYGAEEKLRYFASVATTIRQASTRRATLIVIEDLQWADVASLELLAYLAQKLNNCAVMLIVTVRNDDIEDPDVLACLARLRRTGALEIMLEGLQPEDLRRLIHIEMRGRRLIDLPTRQQIEEAAEGNPLYTEEMLRAFLDGIGKARGTTPVIPATMRAVVKQRVRSLTQEALEVLRFAAVMGRSFNAAFIAELTSQKYTAVLDSLEHACAQQLIVEQTGDPGTFAFRHALIREALYDELLHEDARAMHLRIAQALRERPNVPLSELAYHFGAAGEDALAVEYNERAGDEALGLLACRDAIRFYRRVLQCSYPPGKTRAEFYRKYAVALNLEGIHDESAVWFEAAVEEFKAAGDLSEVANALMMLNRPLWALSRTSDARAVCMEAREILASLPPSVLAAQNHLECARMAITLADVENALRDLQKAETLESELDDAWVARYYETLGETLAGADRAHESVEAFRKAVDFAERSGNANLVVQVENAFAMSSADLGLTADMIAAHRRALSNSNHGVSPWRAAYTRTNAAYTAFMTGEPQRGRELLQSVVAYGADNSTIRIRSAAAGIPIAIMLGDETLLAELADERIIEEAFQSGEIQRMGSVAAAFSLYFRTHDRPHDAKALLARAAARISRIHRCWSLVPEVAGYGDLDDARAMLELCRSRARSGENHAAAAFAMLAQAYIEKRLESPQAFDTAVNAAQCFKALRWPYYEALAYELAGQKREAVAAHLRTGNLAAARRHDSKAEKSDLTERQQAIAALIAEGCTNRMIAEKLCISENTVENHLAVIYSKLGIRTRAQLASYVSRSQA